MNSLEFINLEIEYLQDMISMDLALVEDEFDLQEIGKKQKRLQTLQQIKAELEAWEIVKKCLCIDTDSWDEYSDSFDYIRFTVASIHPLLGFSRQEIESIKKALEVKENDR